MWVRSGELTKTNVPIVLSEKGFTKRVNRQSIFILIGFGLFLLIFTQLSVLVVIFLAENWYYVLCSNSVCSLYPFATDSSNPAGGGDEFHPIEIVSLHSHMAVRFAWVMGFVIHSDLFCYIIVYVEPSFFDDRLDLFHALSQRFVGFA